MVGMMRFCRASRDWRVCDREMHVRRGRTGEARNEARPVLYPAHQYPVRSMHKLVPTYVGNLEQTDLRMTE